jgi:hypothetical protein
MGGTERISESTYCLLKPLTILFLLLCVVIFPLYLLGFVPEVCCATTCYSKDFFSISPLLSF